KGGKGDDDIYRFEELKKLECVAELSGQVMDLKTQEAIIEALVEVFDKEDRLIATLYTDVYGMYSIGELSIDSENPYRIRASKSDYSSDEKHIVSSCGSKEKINLNLERQKLVPKVGDD